MAKTDYGPEVKSAMQETPADRARDKARGIKENSAQDAKIDARPGNQMPHNMPPNMQAMPRPPGDAPTPPDMHHVAAATSIAHAILGNRGLSG
jgi:hypothetical protein